MKKQKEYFHEGITWSEMGKQNEQAKEVYFEWYQGCTFLLRLSFHEFEAVLVGDSLSLGAIAEYPAARERKLLATIYNHLKPCLEIYRKSIRVPKVTTWYGDAI